MPTSNDVDYLRSRAVEYILQWIGTPYKWGGDDFSGFDCSGLIHETLQSVGLEKPGYDCTANQMYLNFKDGKIIEEILYPFGYLVFWFKGSGKAYHVAMLINSLQICEAAGGGAETVTEEDAIRHNAYVRVRRLGYRGTNYKIIDPFKNWDGEEMK